MKTKWLVIGLVVLITFGVAEVKAQNPMVIKQLENGDLVTICTGNVDVRCVFNGFHHGPDPLMICVGDAWYEWCPTLVSGDINRKCSDYVSWHFPFIGQVCGVDGQPCPANLANYWYSFWTSHNGGTPTRADHVDIDAISWGPDCNIVNCTHVQWKAGWSTSTYSMSCPTP